MTGAGHTAELLSLEAGEVQVFDHLDRAETRPAWTLVEADAVRGRRLASWPSLQTDIRNAGGEWVDEEVVEDGNLITSRNPGDLPAFTKALLAALD